MMRSQLKKALLNRVGDWILPRIYRRHVEALMHARAAQEQLFQKWQRQCVGTALSTDIQLSRYASFQEFIRHFPPQPYAFYEPYVRRVMAGEPNVMYKDSTEYFLVTSGTSGFNTKIIPCNTGQRKLITHCQQKAFATFFPEFPGLTLTSDRFAYGSRSRAETINGIPKDYISGVVPFLIPKPLREYVVPSPAALRDPCWTSKVRQIILETRHRDIRGIFGLPAYLLHVLNDIREELGVSNLREIWPHLDFCGYSGTSVQPYRQSLNHLAGAELKFFGVYVSTESPLGFEMPALVTQPGHMCFFPDLVLYSFQDLNGKDSIALSMNELKVGGEYLVNLGTPNGIAHYSIRDYIKVSQTAPFVQFELLGRYDSAINAAAEKVSEAQIERAAHALQEQLCIQLSHYFVYPSEEDSGKPCYEWVFATETSLSSSKLAKAIDLALMDESADYKETRLDTNVLAPPTAQIISPRLVQQLFQRKQAIGQFKMKHVFPDKNTFRSFCKINLEDFQTHVQG